MAGILCDIFGLICHYCEEGWASGRVLKLSIIGTYLIMEDSHEVYHDHNHNLHAADAHEHTALVMANVEIQDGKVYEV